MNRNNTTSNSPIGHTSSWSQISQAHASQGHSPQRPLAVTGTEPSPPGRVGETTQTSLRSPESQSHVSNQVIRLEPGRASNLRATIRRYVTLHLRPSIAQRHPLVKPLPTHLETHLNILRNLFNGRVLMGGTKRDMVMGLTSRANDTDLYLQTRAPIEPDATTLESIKAEAFHRAEGSWQFKFRSDVLGPLIANASDEDIAAATKIATDKINNFITDKTRSEDFSKQIPATSTQREVRNALKTIIEARLEQQGLVKAFKEDLIADYFDEAYCNWLEQAYRPIICQTLYDTTGVDISPDLMGYTFGITAFKNVNTDRYIVQCTFGLGEDSVDIQITDRLPSRCYTCDGYLIDVFDETIVYLLDPNVVDAAIRDGMAEMGSQVRPTADKLLQLYKKTSRGKLPIDREVIMQYHDLISKSCYFKKAIDLLLNKLRRSSSEQSLQALYNIAQYDEPIKAQLSTAEKKVWRSIKRSIRRVCYETCQGNNIGHELINRIENSRSVITPLGNPIEDRESLITSEFKRDLDSLILFKSFIEDSSLSLSTRRTHQGRILRLSTTITGNRYHCALPMSDRRECHKIMETVRLERSESLIHLASKLGCDEVLKYLTAQARSTHDMSGANEIWQTLPYLNRNTERFLVSLKDTDAKNRYKDLITDVVSENQTSYPYSSSLYLTSSEQCLLNCLRRLDISTLHKVIQDTLFNAQPAVTSIQEQTPEVEIAWNLLKLKIFSLYQTRLKEEGLELLSEYFDLEPTKMRDAFRNLGLLITIGAANSESGHYQQGRRDDEYVCTLSLQRVDFSYSIKTSNIDSYVANILSNLDKREQLKSLAKRLDLTELEPIFSDQHAWVRQDGTTDHSSEDKSTNKKQPVNASQENKPVVTKKDKTTTLVPTVDTTRDAIISTDNGEPSKDVLPSVSPTAMNGPATSLTESGNNSAAQKIKIDKNEGLLSQAATQEKNKDEAIEKEPTKNSAKKKKKKKKKKASNTTQNTTQVPTLNKPNCVLQKDMFGITASFTTPSGQRIEGKLSDYGDGDLETIYQKIIEDKSVALFDGKGTEYQIFVNRNSEFFLADDLSTDDEASALLPEITNPFILSPDGKITLDPNNHDHGSIIELIHEDGTAEFDGSLQSEDVLFEGTIRASPIEKKTKQRKGKKTKQQASVDSPITVRMRPTYGNFSKINQPYPILELADTKPFSATLELQTHSVTFSESDERSGIEALFMLAPCEWPHREEPEIWGSARFTITHDTLGACKRLLNLQELTIDGLHVNSEDYDTRQFSLNREISPIASNTVRSKKAARFESQIELPHYRPTILAREENASISVDRDKLMVSFNVYPVQSLLHGNQSPIRNKVLMKHRLVDDQMELVGVDVFSRDAFNRNQPRPIMHVSLSNDLPGSSMRIFGKDITLDYTAKASWHGGYPSLQTTLTVPLLPNETSGNTKLIELLLSLSNHQDLTFEQKLQIELHAEQAMYLHPNPIDTVSTHPPINNAQYDVLLYASNEQSNANSSNAGLFAGRLEITDHPTEPGHRIISFSTDNRTFRVAGSSFDAPEEGSNIFISTPFHLTLSVDTKHGEMSYQSNLDGFIQTSDAKHVVLMDNEKLTTIMGDEFKLFHALYGMALITIEKTVRAILDKDIQCAHGIMKESSTIIPKFSTKDLLDDKTIDALVLDNLFNIDNREYNFPLKGIISITQALPILNNSDFSAYFTAEGNINRLNIPVQVGQTKRGKLDYQIAIPLFLGQGTVPQITLTVPNLQGSYTVAKALFDPAQRDRIQSMELSHPTAKINSTVNGLTVSRTRLASGELAPEESLLCTINLTKTNTESSTILESGKLLVVESLTQSPGKYDCEYHTNAILPTKHLGSMELTIDHNKSAIAKIESTPSSIDPMAMVPEGTRYQGTLRGDFMLLECWIGDQHTEQLVHLTGRVGQLSGEDYTAKPGFRAMFASAIRSYPDLEERFTALADTLLMVRQLEQEHHSAIHLLREASLLNLEIIRDEIADKCPDPTTTF